MNCVSKSSSVVWEGGKVVSSADDVKMGHPFSLVKNGDECVRHAIYRSSQLPGLGLGTGAGIPL